MVRKEACAAGVENRGRRHWSKTEIVGPVLTNDSNPNLLVEDHALDGVVVADDVRVDELPGELGPGRGVLADSGDETLADASAVAVDEPCFEVPGELRGIGESAPVAVWGGRQREGTVFRRASGERTYTGRQTHMRAMIKSVARTMMMKYSRR